MVRKTKQTGTKKEGIYDQATGTVKLVDTPVTQSSEAPVAMAPIRSALEPYYNELVGRLSETMRSASPGFAALEKIVKGKEGSVEALTLDRDLSTVKAFLRRYGGGIKDKSGRYAAAVVGELEQGVTGAVKDASPRAYEALKEHHNREAFRILDE